MMQHEAAARKDERDRQAVDEEIEERRRPLAPEPHRHPRARRAEHDGGEHDEPIRINGNAKPFPRNESHDISSKKCTDETAFVPYSSAERTEKPALCTKENGFFGTPDKKSEKFLRSDENVRDL